MGIRTRIIETARERGTTAAEVARVLGLYRSNLSAMDAGRRSVSLQAIARIARFLDCSPGDLIEICWAPAADLFRSRTLNRKLHKRDLGTPDGSEKGWVHTAMLAWQRHYRASK